MGRRAGHREGKRLRSPKASCLVLALVLSGCAPVQPTDVPTEGPTESPNVISRPLPAADFPNACRGMGVSDAMLAGDPLDPRVTWLKFGSGREVRLVWPPGWEAHFGANMEVVNNEGKVIFSGGDPIDGVCLKGRREAPDLVLMVWPLH